MQQAPDELLENPSCSRVEKRILVVGFGSFGDADRPKEKWQNAPKMKETRLRCSSPGI